MKISVDFSPVRKVSWKEQDQARISVWTPPSTGVFLGVRVEGCGLPGRIPHLSLIDLQQHWAGRKAAVVEHHVGQNGQLGGRAFQGPRFRLQGLLWSMGQPSQVGDAAG